GAPVCVVALILAPICLRVSASGPPALSPARPGFAPLLQARGGLMPPRVFGGPPQYLRTAPTDYYTAALGAQAVLAALFTRERTGRGQRVETSLLQGVMALQSGIAVSYPGKPTVLRENPTYRLYQGGDGEWFVLACRNQAFGARLCRAMGMEEFTNDPRFGSWILRQQNNEALLPVFEKRFGEKPAAEWLKILADHDIPAGPVKTVLQFMDDPAVRHHDL